MSIESGPGGPAAEAAKQHEAKMERERAIKAKMEGIRSNPGESRSDAEIRAQAEAETDAGVEVNQAMKDEGHSEGERQAAIFAKEKAILSEFPNVLPEDARRYAKEEVEQGVVHRPVTIEGDPNVVRERQQEMERVLGGETQEMRLEDERGKELTDALQNVASLFNRLGVEWKLDGAINISLREIKKGADAYFRTHRDVDVHVVGDINGEQLTQLLGELKTPEAPYGYGAFGSDEKLNQSDLVKKRGYLATEFKKGSPPGFGLRFFRLDENGDPHFRIGEIVIDVHFSAGPLKSLTGKALPESWQGANERATIGGEEVSLDAVGSVIYHKLIMGRPRDLLDLKFMVDHGQVRAEDIDVAEQVIQEDFISDTLHTDQKEQLSKAMETLTEMHMRLESVDR